ncbi:MAG: hypothetical protein ACJ8AD_05740 [Gemmatimonadaceae bacterium]
MLRARTWQRTLLAIGSLALSAPLAAQTATSDSAKTRTSQPAQVTLPPLNFSGVIFGSYNYQLPTTPNQFTNQTNNQFIVDRAYLTFRIGAGDRTSIRVTTDVYQTSEATPNAFTVRAKYAYLQYDGNRAANGSQLIGRLGILQNVLIEHEEQFWPRYLSTVPTERAGYFASADVGLVGQYTLPNRLGELYSTIVNGPGYTSRENNRFKDFAARLSLTPLGNSAVAPLAQSLTLTLWGYKGANASNFVNGNAALAIAPVGEAMDRDRAGVLVGVHDPRLTFAAQYATRRDERDTASATLPRTVLGTKGNVWSVYGTARPLAFVNSTRKSALGIVGRYDRVSPSTSSDNAPAGALVPSTSNSYHTLIAGLFWDLSQKAQLALDYQESLATSNDLSLTPSPSGALKGYYAHFVVNF